MKKALVFGAGLSGLGAKELLEKNNYKVYLIDDKVGIPSSEGIEILNREEIEFIVPSKYYNGNFMESRIIESGTGKKS